MKCSENINSYTTRTVYEKSVQERSVLRYYLGLLVR